MDPRSQNQQQSPPFGDPTENSQTNGRAQERSERGQGNSESNQPKNAFEPPVINLPKGGGAIQGIGEKFQANPVTGTGSMSVPIAMSPGRGGFTPQLALSYDSGAGNSPYGLGWNIGLPSISRKTSKGLPEYDGLPKYHDTYESDVFLLSGAEDLVPQLENGTRYERTEGDYIIHRYIPRIEGLFARIEKWTNTVDQSSYWKSITKENITTIYGQAPEAQIRDPKDSWKILQWKIEKSYDDKGNVILYQYKKEDGVGLDPKPIFEKNRNSENAYNQTYLKRVLYGNTIPYGSTDFNNNEWLFELILDYGEHYRDGDDVPKYDEQYTWNLRKDIFSSFRSGFNIRTYRLCRQILMFHHFEDELGIPDYLVKSTALAHDEADNLTTVKSITHTGYRYDQSSQGYTSKSYPPVSFLYTEQKIDANIYEIRSDDLPNAPQGIDGQQYQFVDLYKEGLNGILSQKQGAWYYKRNEGDGKFGAQRSIAELPSIAANSQVQVSDIEGNGLTDIVIQNGALNGYYEMDEDEKWRAFKPFRNPVNINLNDPNTRMLDLDGNGIPDILITEHDCFVWYPADAKEGYQKANRVSKVLDEEQGARVVFQESFQSIFLADMSGDGLTDIVRIRNGEICYWANMGYGRFSPKITMADAPHFDHPDYFDPNRIRTADINGDGSTDILYLGRDEIKYWFNNSGNGWSDSNTITSFPKSSNLHTISVFDLLGNGTSCIVWSSPLPAEANIPMKYIKLMGNNAVEGNKPYLLKEVNNNMGAITRMKYEASTKFYLEDRKSGKPWITKLPFPVQVMVRQEIFDEIAGNHFVTRYAYHHGYFDSVEREFRGFGMVEQWDTEDFESLSINSLFENKGQNWSEEYDMPPVYTKTWFHNGYYRQGYKISRQYESEYFNEDSDAWLLPDTELPDNLNNREKREAARALKGRPLRVEVYGLDGSDQEAYPYTVAETKYHIRTIQNQESHRHASFYVCECESISYQYERLYTPPSGGAPGGFDPRIAHQSTLEIDQFGNVLRAAAIVYPRRSTNALPEQQNNYITLTEADFVNKSDEQDYYRIGVPYAQRVYEITGINLNQPYDKEALDLAILAASPIPFEADATSGIQKRLISNTKNTFYKDDLSGAMPFGEIAFHALPYQTSEAVYTQGLINKYNKDGNTLITAADLENEGGYIQDGDYWWRTSGKAIFNPNQFYLPVEQLDPFGHPYLMENDSYHLAMIKTSTDIYNKTIQSTAQLNYRTLQPHLLIDPNGNQQEVITDELGMVIATAISGDSVQTSPLGAGGGAAREGDSLDNYNRITYPDQDLRSDIYNNRSNYLQAATTFFYYDLHAWRRDSQPNYALSIVREKHNDPNTPTQINFSYSDGFGQAIMVKVQAEPGDAHRIDSGNLINDFAATRWVGNGRTVFNNKGNPVKQYEPFFSHSYDYETESELIEYGVTPILHYDPVGRNIRTDLPDGTFTKVAFTPWEQKTYDQNDTVLDSQWYIDRGSPQASNPEPNVINNPNNYAKRAAWLAAQHADTSKVEHLDTLGRVFLMVDDNGQDGLVNTRFHLDIQGNQVKVIDAKDRLITINHYNMANEVIHTESMDAGRRWMVTNIMGNPIYQWTDRDYRTRLEYDDLQRNTATFVQDPSGGEKLVYFNVYGERLANPAATNHYGQRYQLYDQAGCKTTTAIDFKGNPLSVNQQVCIDYKNTIDWSVLHGLTNTAAIQNAAASILESEVFTTSSEVDALNRPIKSIAPDNSETIYTYNEANFLESINHAPSASTSGSNQAIVKNIDYDAKGQRTRIQYGNGVTTTYEYDEITFRLIRLRSTRGNLAGGLPSSGVGGGAAILQDLQYHYDPVGNITDMRDDAQQTLFYQNAPVEPHSSYTYDALYRLIKAIGREHPGQTASPGRTHKDFEASSPIPHANDGKAMRRYSRTYEYDELGNMLLVQHKPEGTGLPPGQAGWTRTYEYNEISPLESGKVNNQLSKTSLTNPTATHTYTHDIHGNMTSMPHLPEMLWDYADQLKEVQLDLSNNREYYTYTIGGGKDFGVRTRKVTELNGKIKDRIYIGDHEVYREYKAGSIELERTSQHIQDSPSRDGGNKGRIALIDKLIIENQSPITKFQLSNHLGSATLEVDDAGAIINYEEYYPFGASSYRSGKSATEVAQKRYRYVGKERDESTSLDYYGARYYGSWLCRWINKDPFGYIDGLNLFQFSQNNPINNFDPEGKYTVNKADDRGYEYEKTHSTFHLVQKGETYSELALRYHTSVDKLRDWNEYKDRAIPIGAILKVSELKSYSTEGNTKSLTTLNLTKSVTFEDHRIDYNISLTGEFKTLVAFQIGEDTETFDAYARIGGYFSITTPDLITDSTNSANNIYKNILSPELSIKGYFEYKIGGDKNFYTKYTAEQEFYNSSGPVDTVIRHTIEKNSNFDLFPEKVLLDKNNTKIGIAGEIEVNYWKFGNNSDNISFSLAGSIEGKGQYEKMIYPPILLQLYIEGSVKAELKLTGKYTKIK